MVLFFVLSYKTLLEEALLITKSRFCADSMKVFKSCSMTYRIMNFKKNAWSINLHSAGQFLMTALLQPPYLSVLLRNLSERHMSIFRSGVCTKWFDLWNSGEARKQIWVIKCSLQSTEQTMISFYMSGGLKDCTKSYQLFQSISLTVHMVPKSALQLQFFFVLLRFPWEEASE